MTPADIIATLGMEPHPEGGWYVQTFRDTADGDQPGGSRGHSTAIYYLLERGDRSHWHKVIDAAEVWHYYAGSPIRLSISQDGVSSVDYELGVDMTSGARPQVVVPANWWQSAEPMGDWTLVGCTVAPGFTFESFEMAPPGWKPG
jgi:uncharacterized protein